MFIYKVTNKINKKIYIGLTTNPIEKRFKKHTEAKEGLLSLAIKKYGKENFLLEQIDVCQSYEELREKEKFWIEKLKPEYNMTKGGEGLFGFKHSKETKEKISLKNKNKPPSDPLGLQLLEYRKKHGNPFKGKKHKEEWKIKQSKTKKELYESEKGKKLRKQISETLKSKGFKPINNGHVKNTCWWNNGSKNKRSKNCPGNGYILGRIKWKNEG